MLVVPLYHRGEAAMAAVCPHGFPNPATRYGEVLLPPHACNACRSDYFSRAAIRPGVAYSGPNQAFEEEPWDCSRYLFYQNANDLSKVQGSQGPNGFGPSPPPTDPIQAQARTSLPQTQELRQRTKSRRPSHCNILFVDGNNGSHVAKRRGPLTEGGRDNIKRVRTKSGACWRCKVLKKQVSLLKVFPLQIVNCISVMEKLHVKNAQPRMHMLENGILNANGETSKTRSRARFPVGLHRIAI